MPSNFIFTLTAGRTGTMYLSHLLKANQASAAVYHEILGYNSFGIDTPDLSHLLQFNSRGNTDWVKQFWKVKWSRVLAHPQAVYAESSHILMKAGLMENIRTLTEQGNVHCVILKRDWYKVIKSYLDRHDFNNIGSCWMWYLDPKYPKNLIPYSHFKGLPEWGIGLWYVSEIATRAEFYRQQLSGIPNLHFHEVDLADIVKPEGAASLLNALGVQPDSGKAVIPPPANENHGERSYPPKFLDDMKYSLSTFKLDPPTIAADRLSNGVNFEVQ